MTKEELVHLTLNQLSDNLSSSPQNFRLEDSEIAPITSGFLGPTIVWQFKVETDPGSYIQDPLNATRTIIVTYNDLTKQICCHIYFREINSFHHSCTPDSQATIQLYDFPIIHRTYRQFRKLRNRLLKRKREQEYLDYLKKLNNIFPSTHVDELFK
jgi:phenylalanine-4-hydroxylase